MLMSITAQAAPCGATVQGIELRQPLAADTVARLRQAWLAQQLLGFPDQDLSLEDLERIALHFGPCGSDPYFSSVPGHPHIRRYGAMPTRRRGSLPRPGIRAGASCRRRRSPRCSTAPSSRRSAATRCSPADMPPGTRCQRR